MTFNCSSNKTHILLWSSSPYLLNLVTRTMIRGFACSGVLPVQYTRFVKGVKVDLIQQKNIDNVCSVLTLKKRGKQGKYRPDSVKAVTRIKPLQYWMSAMGYVKTQKIAV